jgi:hypothetical protein
VLKQVVLEQVVLEQVGPLPEPSGRRPFGDNEPHDQLLTDLEWPSLLRLLVTEWPRCRLW